MKSNSLKSTIATVLVSMLLLAIVVPFLRQSKMDLPGTDYTSPACPINPSECSLLIDSTTFDPDKKERIIKQEIFDEALKMVAEAHSFIVADFFLLNPWKGTVPENHRALSSELAAALIAKKKAEPDMRILLLTDPINRIYGEDEPRFYHDMAAAGISIVFTDVGQLPPSNLLYSPVASVLLPLVEKLPSVRARLLPNPFNPKGPKISPLQMLRLLNFRANHRKLMVTDRPDGKIQLLATSFNPADGSAAHSNIGISVTGPVARYALAAELDCILWSAAKPRNRLLRSNDDLEAGLAYCRSYTIKSDAATITDGHPYAQWLTEKAVRRKLLEVLARAGEGDSVDIAMFYFSDRALVEAVKSSAQRGARVRIIMDANKDAFGREKNGIPNRTVAAELMRGVDNRALLDIRWASTHGEQFHTKAIAVLNESRGKSELLCGSANWTRRNIQNHNLEASIFVCNAPGIVQEFADYFDNAWNNSGNGVATADYGRYAESGWSLLWKTALYRWQEKTGACTF